MGFKYNTTTKYDSDTWYFHMFRSIINSGDAARMGGTTFLVYAVIKSHANYNNGLAFPSIKTIAEKAGISKEQAKRCVKKLHIMGFLTKSKENRNNIYTIREKIGVYDSKGHTVAIGIWDYRPSTVKTVIDELKGILNTGTLQATMVINFEKPMVQEDHENDIKRKKEQIEKIEDPDMRQAMQDFFSSIYRDHLSSA